jgi:deoxyribonuclease-4
MTLSQKPLLIGAHTSASGGAHLALLEGKEIGAATVQLFTRNQKRWEAQDLSREEIDLFEQTLEETGLSHIMSHDSYLINLGCPNEENLLKSRTAFRKELLRCQALGISYLNFHPGAALDSSEEACLDLIVESLDELSDLADKGPTRLLIETTAGQGSTVGYSFEHLSYIIERVDKKIPIGVCIDTCHIFSAGYDLRTPKAFEHTFAEFDKIVGLKHLYAFHVNDSMKPFASRKDRHAPLGEGEIGMECFKLLMQHPKLKYIPKYLETPDGPALWKKEIALLKKFAEG